MVKTPPPDVSILKSVIFTLNSLQFPLEAARRGDETMSRIAGCLDALEQLVAEAEAAAVENAEAEAAAVEDAMKEVTDDA